MKQYDFIDFSKRFIDFSWKKKLKCVTMKAPRKEVRYGTYLELFYSIGK